MERNVVTFRLGVDDLAAVRFARWPTHELVRAIAVVQDPGRHPLQWGWLRGARDRLPDKAFRLLATVVPPTGYTPDILTPPPDALRDPRDEIALITQAPAHDVRRDLTKVRATASGPRALALDRLLARPERAGGLLAEAAAELWEALLADHWPAMTEVLAADIAHRSRLLAADGFAAMARSLHERVDYGDGLLSVRLTAWQAERPPADGLVLVPSVFSWPGCSVMTESLRRPVLAYPALGVGPDWAAAATVRAQALAAVIGEGRARVLAAVGRPVSTSEVASACELAVSTASEHLAALRAVGWVSSARRGRRVEHVRTPTGELVARGR